LRWLRFGVFPVAHGEANGMVQQKVPAVINLSEKKRQEGVGQ
jgi:hypothetical protein